MEAELALGPIRGPRRYVHGQLGALVWRFLLYKRYYLKSSLMLDLVLPALGALIASLSLGRGSFSEDLPSLMPSINMFIFCWHFVSLMYWLVLDNTSGFRHLMQSMGLSDGLLYTSNAINMMLQLVPLAGVVATLTGRHFLAPMAPLIIWLAYLLFVGQLMGLMWTLASFVHSRELLYLVFVLAATEGLLSSLKNYALTHYVESAGWRQTIVYLCTVSPQESMRLIYCGLSLDGTPTGRVCQNLFYEGFEPALPLAVPLALMAIWCLVLTLFGVYFDHVCPWQKYRSPQGALFFLELGKRPALTDSGHLINQAEMVSLGHLMEGAPVQQPASARWDPFDSKDRRYFEEAPRSLPVAIEMVNVSKQFARQSRALHQLSLNVYYGQTSLLLGQNGAGKTTLMSIITGQLQATEGRVIIRRRPSDHGVQPVRLGICPQDSILCQFLTVGQHLNLLHAIKMRQRLQEQHLQQVLADVGLANERHKRPSELSGGMRRKLSLAMAFVGDSQILVLDEPSSGLDPGSRRLIWNSINRYKSNRALLLSTQHMEEADYLSDRVAIMGQGEIICCGSSGFLKRTFACGYKLRIETTRDGPGQRALLEVVRQYFSEARPLTGLPDQAGQDLQIELGDRRHHQDQQADGTEQDEHEHEHEHEEEEEEHDSRMVGLLERLERDAHSLGVKSFGLQCASVEDVLQNTMRLTQTTTTTNTQSHKLHQGANLELVAARSHARHTREASGIHVFGAFMAKQVHLLRHRWPVVLLARLLIPGLAVLAMCLLIGVTVSLCVQHAVHDSEQFLDMSSSIIIPLSIVLVLHVVHWPASERHSRFKLVQLATTNATLWHYWLSQLVADVASTTLLHAILFSAITQITKPTGYDEATYEALGGQWLFHVSLMLIFLLFGVCACLMAYIVASMTRSSQLASLYFVLIYQLTPLTKLLVMMYKLVFSSSQAPACTSKLLDLYDYLLPGNLLGLALIKLFNTSVINQIDQSSKVALYDWSNGFSQLLLQFVLMALAMAGLLYTVDTHQWLANINLFRSVARAIATVYYGSAPDASLLHTKRPVDIHEDVHRERRRIQSLLASSQGARDEALVVEDLTKSFARDRRAVDGLTFGVSPGQCFGLLGINGAGKSTTFSMLTGDLTPDSGRVICIGRALAAGWCQTQQYRQQLGFDPQHNYELHMTPLEVLYFVAKLRGIAQHEVAATVEALVHLLDMRAHANKLVKNLSGGTKRKLTLAVALIGVPSFVMLDEPTAGIDPLARRDIWELLCKMKSKFQQNSARQSPSSFLVSSHAMEECEAICDRLTIMIDGHMTCIGTFQHLREIYNQGYTVKVQFCAGSVSDHELTIKCQLIHKSLQEKLDKGDPTRVKYDHTTTGGALFRVLDTANVTRSELYRAMVDIKGQHSATFTFLISDCTLEDIFISRANAYSHGT